MAFRLSNNVIGALNLITFLLSIPVLGASIWLRIRSDGSECDHFLSSPAIAFGAVLTAVSLAGLVGACCRVTWLLWLYLLAMLVLIVALFGLIVFTFVVTNRGAGEAVSGAGYREYRLGTTPPGCGATSGVARTGPGSAAASPTPTYAGASRRTTGDATPAKFLRGGLSPLESGCCKPPTACNFTYGGVTEWTKTSGFVASAADPDCGAWSNDSDKLCYDCQSCKAAW